MRMRMIASLLLCGTLTACGGGGGATPQPVSSPLATVTAPPNNAVPAAGAVYLGLIANTSGVQPPLISDLTTLETQIGRTAAMTTHYYTFYQAFPGPYEANDAANGRIPIESWNCQVPNAEIATGKQDTIIKRQADALRNYGHTVFLRYMWEMNLTENVLPGRSLCYDAGTDEPGGQFSPSEFIAAWDHMRAIFQAEGANNVIWLWNPSGSNNPVAYYPGDSEVDWVGFDKYDGVGTTFLQSFAQIYGWLAPLNKPILIGETGAPASIQPAFFAAAGPTLQSQFPLIKGLCYFDEIGTQESWLLSGQGLAAFKAMANAPYFGAKLQ